MNPMSMFAGMSQDQLDEMLARLGQTAAPADDAGAADNPFRRAAAQPVPQEIAQLPPEQLDQFPGSMKESPADGGAAKTRNAAPDQVVPPASRPLPVAGNTPRAAPFNPYPINTSAPNTVSNMTTVTNPNEEAAALLRQQYNTGFSDFMGAGSQFGPEHDERMKVIAANLGQGRANQFTGLIEQQRAQQFSGTQNDLSRQAHAREGDLDRIVKQSIAEGLNVNNLAVAGVHNVGGMDVAKQQGVNQIGAIVAADKTQSGEDKQAAEFWKNAYGAAIQGGKDSTSARAMADDATKNYRHQFSKDKSTQGQGVQLTPDQIPPQYRNQMIVGTSVNTPTDNKQLGLGATDKVDAVLKTFVNTKDPDKMLEAIMSQKLSPAESDELARRLKKGEGGDPVEVQKMLAQQVAVDNLLAQPPQRDQQGKYPGSYSVPGITLTPKPADSPGSYFQRGWNNLRTNTGNIFRSDEGYNAIPYDTLTMSNGITVPFDPKTVRTGGVGNSADIARRTTLAHSRLKYSSPLYDAILNGK